MVFPARIGEEPREVVHALAVAQVDDVPFEDHRPVVAVAAEDVHATSPLLIGCVTAREIGCWDDRRRGLDLVEDRAGRLLF